VEGCGLHKEEKWRGLCTSLLFFFLETEQEGVGNGRRGASGARAAEKFFKKILSK
jgi:hypothetical protein